jgi:hypothetical protein
MQMTNLESTPYNALQVLLDEHGIVPPANTISHSTEWELDLGITKLGGVEVTLPVGIIGKLVVRQIQQLPDKHTASLSQDDPRALEFEEQRMSGLFADVRLQSVSSSHLLVARKAIVNMQNTSGTHRVTMQTDRSFAAGKAMDTERLLDFDTEGAAITRPLKLSEMDYSEPNKIAMVFAALKRR